MAYEKQTWQTGDVVTSAKLNHMEDGIAAAGHIVGTRIDETDYSLVLTSTWAEVKALCESGPVYIYSDNSDDSMTNISCAPVVLVMSYDGTYTVSTLTTDGLAVSDLTYSASSADDYPRWSEDH